MRIARAGVSTDMTPRKYFFKNPVFPEEDYRAVNLMRSLFERCCDAELLYFRTYTYARADRAHFFSMRKKEKNGNLKRVIKTLI